ncbi:MAG: hypothetical protein ACFB6S_13765 [Geminicoccaceae bacterium]
MGEGPPAPEKIGHLEMIALLRPALETLHGEMQRSLSLQDELAQNLSRHTTALAPHCSQETIGDVHGLMVALQGEDRLRQRHEGVIELVSTLLTVIGNAAASLDAGANASVAQENDRRNRWVSELVDGQKLEELKESLHRAFAKNPEEHPG